MKNVPSTSGCADLLKALGDATRLQVLQVLLGGPLHVNDLQEKLGTEQSLLSHHLKVLREAGLVLAERDGKAVLYRISPEVKGTGQGIDLKCCQVTFHPVLRGRRGS
jgi:ArsR family transcriptional regulator, nickel/cobalt-responsive transcriptional repressor